MIYLDNAATTAVCKKSIKQLLKWNKKYGNSESVYKIGREASAEVEKVRDFIKEAIGASNAAQIVFTSGGCEGNSTAIKSMVLEVFQTNKPISIAITGMEHHSVINAVKWAERFFNAKIHYFPLKNGRIDTEQVIRAEFFKRNNINVCSIIWGNNETGAVQFDIGTLLREAQQNGVLTHVDAVQIVPHFGVTALKAITDQRKCKADYITFSGHKIGAPKGIGVLYCANPDNLIPLIDGGEQERGKRGGTINVGLISSLGAAIEAINADFPTTLHSEFYSYIRYIYENLITPENLSLNNPLALIADDGLMGIVNIDCKEESAPIVAFLDMHGVCVSTGSACNGGGNYSYVLEKMGLNPRTSLRVSFSAKTKIKDIKIFVKRMHEYFALTKKLKGET